MAATFDNALKLIKQLEGGFSDNPKDPGGATMCGITQVSWDRYSTVEHDFGTKPVHLLTEVDIHDFYFEYWHTFRCDSIAAVNPLFAITFFQFAVNAGRNATIMWQRYCQITTDGLIGIGTLATIHNDTNYLELLIQQLNYYTSLKEWKDFSYIWARRILSTNNFLATLR